MFNRKKIKLHLLFITHLSGKIVRELEEIFRETDSVKNKKRQVENLVLNEPVELAVLWQVAMDGTMTTIQLTGTQLL